MQDQYTAPELKLVGDTDDVVLGLPGMGPDFLGNYIIGENEFLED